MKKLIICLVLFAVVGTGLSSAAIAEDGTIVRSSKLYAKASFSAKPKATLAIGTEVQVQKRKGGWKQIVVKVGGKTGWIRGYTMRTGVSASQAKQASTTSNSKTSGGLASFGRSLTSLFGGNTNRNQNEGNLTTTVGIRGLSAEQIESAKPDKAAADKMITFQVSANQSTQFASRVKLKQISLAHIKVKKKKPSNSGANNEK